MILKNGFGNCSLFVLSASGWKDQSMDWRKHCSIGQSFCSMPSKYRLISRKIVRHIIMKFFHRAFA